MKVEKNFNDKIEKVNFPKNDFMATAKAISNICENVKITKIIAVTRSGFAARTLSSMNILKPIIAVSDNFQNAKTFNLLKGVKSYFFETKFKKNNLMHIPKFLKNFTKRNKYLQKIIF